ncbi:hypothetical protein BDV24DRAFT_128509 [Aspergillus arachidicola]|uniref:Uncharacterized protein n=1 Tax=Aspergillus arachidicola TaxID=656916 RepID=A0A5N6YGH5_9EURO|nr:hypothetical protein BDV24DRAFT_128509 [Aspergillus arachidicola]
MVVVLTFTTIGLTRHLRTRRWSNYCMLCSLIPTVKTCLAEINPDRSTSIRSGQSRHKTGATIDRCYFKQDDRHPRREWIRIHFHRGCPLLNSSSSGHYRTEEAVDCVDRE